MKRISIVGVVVLAGLAWSASAWAVVESCVGVSNGVPCVGPCVVSGVCTAQMCVGMVRPDTTPCSSGNHCTTDDFCQGGVCQPGPTQISCPGTDACTVGVCIPATGCAMQFICDLAMPDLTQLDLPEPDLFGVDLSGVDLSTVDAPITDMAAPDGAGQDGVFADGLTNDANNTDALFRNVRGSNVGGCTCEMTGATDSSSSTGIILLSFSMVSLVGLMHYRRRRALRGVH